MVDNAGVNVSALHDIISPGAKAEWLYVAAMGENTVYKLWLSGRNPDAPIAAIGSPNEVAVPPGLFGTANVETPLLTDVGGVHGMDFVAAPEPSTWAMILLGFSGLAFLGYRQSCQTQRRESASRQSHAGK
jgi:hypothetical protein